MPAHVLQSSFPKEAFPPKVSSWSQAGWFVTRMRQPGRPEGRGTRASLLAECNPRYPLTPAMPASQFSTISHPSTLRCCAVLPSLGTNVPTLHPGLDLTEQPSLPLIGRPRHTHNIIQQFHLTLAQCMLRLQQCDEAPSQESVRQAVLSSRNETINTAVKRIPTLLAPALFNHKTPSSREAKLSHHSQWSHLA